MKRTLGIVGVLLSVIVGYTALAQDTVAQDAIDVSLVQLIATPERYDGKRIRVIGFVRLEFEGDAIYLHQEDYQHGISRNGLWLNATSDMRKNRQVIDLHYALIEGIFNAKGHGHMGLFSGAIQQVNRWRLWR